MTNPALRLLLSGLAIGGGHLPRWIARGIVVLLPQRLLYHWRLLLARVRREPWLTEARSLFPGGKLPGDPRSFVRKVWSSSLTPPEPLAATPPLAVVILFRDRGDLLARCVRTVLRDGEEEQLEVVLMDNGSVEEETEDVLDRFRGDSRVRLVRAPGVFNYSRLNNHGASHSMGKVLIFLNSDVQLLEPGSLARLANLAGAEGVGAVGPRLLYPDGRLQHAGIALGLEGVAGHPFRQMNPAGTPDRLDRRDRPVSAVTGACLAVARDRFEAAEGFDEEAFPEVYSDVDLCLRLRRQGLQNWYLGSVTFQHVESATRMPRLPALARANLVDRYEELLKRDPWFHPALCRADERLAGRIAPW